MTKSISLWIALFIGCASAFVFGGMVLSQSRTVAPSVSMNHPATLGPVAVPVAVEAPAPRPLATATPTPAVADAADPGAYVIKRVLNIPGPMRQGDHYWDEAGVPPGPVVLTVDLAAQTVSIFRGGYEIGTSVIIYGADNMPTPLGVFPITQKDAHHVSNLYDAPMPYMLRLTNDGVSIHGSKVGNNYATHGCIGVPVAFAKQLFAAVKLGDKVIVTNGERLHQGAAIKAA